MFEVFGVRDEVDVHLLFDVFEHQEVFEVLRRDENLFYHDVENAEQIQTFTFWIVYRASK